MIRYRKGHKNNMLYLPESCALRQASEATKYMVTTSFFKYCGRAHKKKYQKFSIA
jgi:hypothetical protein